MPDLNLTELFRTNRYVGEDRIGDANQMALALTTRLFDQCTGAQYLSATIGQIRYFSIPRVGLPADAQRISAADRRHVPGVNPLALPGQALVNSRGQILMSCPGQYVCRTCPRRPCDRRRGRDSRRPIPASDIVADVSVTAYKHFSFNLDYQWNPYTSQTDKSEVSLQYRPDPTRVVNIGYRFQENVLTAIILKQWDGSFAWPIAGHWNTVGRWVYSLQDHQTIEQVAGFEYKSCCWRSRWCSAAMSTNRHRGTGHLDCITIGTDGLKFGRKACGCLLGTEIRGYSTRDPNAQNSAP